jgi:hypothetical protein
LKTPTHKIPGPFIASMSLPPLQYSQHVCINKHRCNITIVNMDLDQK